MESLDPRLMLALTASIDPVFAPDTPQDYLAAFEPSITPAAVGSTPGISAFQFNDTDRWSGTTSNGGGLGQGDPTTLTWSIVPDGTSIFGYADEATSPSNLQARLDTIYGSSATWLPLFQQTFDRWSELTGITYVYESVDDGSAWTSNTIASGQLGVRGDVRIAGHNIDGSSGILAYNFFPNFGDMVIDTGDMSGSGFFQNTGSNSIRLRNVVAHEAGHGVGVDHVESSSANFLMEPFVDLSFDGPQFDDILAVQRGYGDALEAGAGNDAASVATDLGTIAGGQTVHIGQDAVDAPVAPADTDLVSIDDNSDTDYLSFTVNSAGSIDVLLAPLGPTYLQGPQGGTQSSFNAKAQSDLAFEVLGTDGTSLLAAADATGLGGNELVSGVTLAGAGTYYVKIDGAQNAAQFYQLDVSFTAGATGPITANNDSAASGKNGVTVDVLANDTPVAGLATDTVDIVEGNGPTNGSITNIDLQTGAITYVPNKNYTGTDTFGYTVEDLGGELSNEATVVITVSKGGSGGGDSGNGGNGGGGKPDKPRGGPRRVSLLAESQSAGETVVWSASGPTGLGRAQAAIQNVLDTKPWTNGGQQSVPPPPARTLTDEDIAALARTIVDPVKAELGISPDTLLVDEIMADLGDGLAIDGLLAGLH